MCHWATSQSDHLLVSVMKTYWSPYWIHLHLQIAMCIKHYLHHVLNANTTVFFIRSGVTTWAIWFFKSFISPVKTHADNVFGLRVHCGTNGKEFTRNVWDGKHRKTMQAQIQNKHGINSNHTTHSDRKKIAKKNSQILWICQLIQPNMIILTLLEWTKETKRHYKLLTANI